MSTKQERGLWPVITKDQLLNDAPVLDTSLEMPTITLKQKREELPLWSPYFDYQIEKKSNSWKTLGVFIFEGIMTFIVFGSLFFFY